MDKPLLPERHPDSEIFFCDIDTNIIKDDMISMEHPFFVLTKQPYTKVREYNNGKVGLKIIPGLDDDGEIIGVPNIWDKDVLIFITSQLMQAKKQGLPYSNKVHFKSIDNLVFCNKETSGREYQSLKKSLQRLQSVSIETNLRSDDTEKWRRFGLVDDVEIVREKNGKITEWKVKLSDFFMHTVLNNEVLTLNPDYFRLKKPTEKRLYEIARKHCGKKEEWKIGLDLLQKKCGATCTKKRFRRTLKEIETHQHLPDYRIKVENDNIVFYRFGDVGVKNLDTENVNLTKVKTLSPSAMKTFKQKFPGYDFYAYLDGWQEWLDEDMEIKNPEGSFIDYCKRNIKNPDQYRDRYTHDSDYYKSY